MSNKINISDYSKFIVTDNYKNPSFNGTINIVNNKFVVEKGSTINMKPNKEARQGVLLNLGRTIGKFVDSLGKVSNNIEFSTLSEAAMSICMNTNYKDYTFIDIGYDFDIDNKNGSLVSLSEIDNFNSIPDSEKPISMELPQTQPNFTKNNNQQKELSDSELLAMLIDRFTRPKTIELGENTLNSIFNHLDSQKQESIEDDTEFNWNETYKIPENSEIIGEIGHKEIDDALNTSKKAVIIEGVPGTGKTKLMLEYVDSKADSDHVLKITFHQEYSYHDFIGGVVAKDGGFVYQDGVFTKFCKLANSHPDEDFYLAIDEFSRGNTESILGEVMTAICNRGRVITLSSGRKFMVPENVYILASMNITDISTKNIDLATYQRFQHIRMNPQWTDEYIIKLAENCSDNRVLDKLEKVKNIMVDINEAIKKDPALGPDYVIGTRDISGDNISLESISKGIEDGLIPSIKKSTARGYSNNDVIRELMKNLKGLV